jgi:hypothetical protein
LFGEVHGLSDAFCNLWRADRRQWRRQEADGISAPPGAVTVPNGEVESLTDKIDAIVVGLDAKVDKRLRLAEGR